MSAPDSAFAVQPAVRRPWRDYLDALVPLRPDLHRYCCRLTGNVWDGEDLVQDTLLRVFGLLGKIDADLAEPRAYLLRTATHLWIDRMRRRGRERALLAAEGAAASHRAFDDPDRSSAVRDAAGALLERLPPRERAAVLLKDVFDLSLEEIAAMLHTSVGAVKSALHRGRERLDADEPVATAKPSAATVERFLTALAAKDLAALEAICSADVTIELVGGAELEGFAIGRTFFEHAHFVLPALGFGANPNWRVALYEGEPVVLGFRTLDGVEGLNEIHRLEESDDGRVTRVRCYCFCPDTLRAVAERMGIAALRRPYRSPG
jgi:RNA polymerase sigma-70 factor (ECF subfamily)